MAQNSESNLLMLGIEYLAYVRTISPNEVMESIPLAVRNVTLEADQVLYAVHAANGEKYAIYTDCERARIESRKRGLTLVRVH